MSAITTLAMIVGRGNRIGEACEVGYEFVARGGSRAGEALHSVKFDEVLGHTLVVVTSEELRRFFLRRADWVEWAPGEAYPL